MAWYWYLIIYGIVLMTIIAISSIGRERYNKRHYEDPLWDDFSCIWIAIFWPVTILIQISALILYGICYNLIKYVINAILDYIDRKRNERAEAEEAKHYAMLNSVESPKPTHISKGYSD